MLQSYTVKATATALGVDPRTVRRWIAAGQAPGAQQVQTVTGPAWMLPLATVEALRSKVARLVEPVPQVEPVHRSPQVEAQQVQQPAPLAVHQLDTQAGQLGAMLGTLRAALDSQAATIAGQLGLLEAARDDALWWRCEALDARQQLDQVRAQLAAAQVELAQLRAVVERHTRPTVTLGELRQLRAVEG